LVEFISSLFFIIILCDCFIIILMTRVSESTYQNILSLRNNVPRVCLFRSRVRSGSILSPVSKMYRADVRARRKIVSGRGEFFPAPMGDNGQHADLQRQIISLTGVYLIV